MINIRNHISSVNIKQLWAFHILPHFVLSKFDDLLHRVTEFEVKAAQEDVSPPLPTLMCNPVWRVAVISSETELDVNL